MDHLNIEPLTQESAEDQERSLARLCAARYHWGFTLWTKTSNKLSEQALEIDGLSTSVNLAAAYAICAIVVLTYQTT